MAKKQSKPRPVEKIRAYPVTAAIWKNESENGTFFSVTFSRSYKGDDGYHDVDSYSGTQLLQLAYVASQAYARVEALTQQARAGEAEEDEEENA